MTESQTSRETSSASKDNNSEILSSPIDKRQDGKWTLVDEPVEGSTSAAPVALNVRGDTESAASRPHASSNTRNGQSSTPRPRNNDVIMGRGRPYQSFSGNRRMLQIVADHKEEYHVRPRDKKRGYVDVVHKVILQGGTRFLRRIEENSVERWEEVDKKTAAKKVWHALRCKSRGEKDRTSEQGAISGESTTPSVTALNTMQSLIPTPSPLPSHGGLNSIQAPSMSSGIGINASSSWQPLITQMAAQHLTAQPTMQGRSPDDVFRQAQELSRLLSIPQLPSFAMAGVNSLLQSQHVMALLFNPQPSMAMVLARGLVLPSQAPTHTILPLTLQPPTVTSTYGGSEALLRQVQQQSSVLEIPLEIPHSGDAQGAPNANPPGPPHL